MSVSVTAPLSAVWMPTCGPVVIFGKLIESVPPGRGICVTRLAIMRPARGKSP